MSLRFYLGGKKTANLESWATIVKTYLTVYYEPYRKFLNLNKTKKKDVIFLQICYSI